MAELLSWATRVQVMVTICLSKKMKYLATARCLLVGYIAVAVVLSTISADRFNNLRNVTAHRGDVRCSENPPAWECSLPAYLHQDGRRIARPDKVFRPDKASIWPSVLPGQSAFPGTSCFQPGNLTTMLPPHVQIHIEARVGFAGNLMMVRTLQHQEDRHLIYPRMAGLASPFAGSLHGKQSAACRPSAGTASCTWLASTLRG